MDVGYISYSLVVVLILSFPIPMYVASSKNQKKKKNPRCVCKLWKTLTIEDKSAKKRDQDRRRNTKHISKAEKLASPFSLGVNNQRCKK